MIGRVKAMAWGALVCSLAAASPVWAQPTDDCAAAPVLGVGVHNFTTVGSTGDTAAVCGGSAMDVWFKHTPSTSGFLTVKTCGVTFAITAFDGCGGNALACTNVTFAGGCGSERRINLPVTASQTVWFRLARSSGTGAGTVELIMNSVTPPGNDLCASATPLTLGVPQAANFNNASAQGAVSCGRLSGKFSPDIWFKYDRGASPAGIVSVKLCGGTFYSEITAFDTCGGNPLACSAIALPNGCTDERRFNVPVAQNQTLYIRVAEASNAGTGTIEIVELASPVANDSCTNAETILVGQEKLIDTTNATADAVSACAGTASTLVPFPLHASVWYTYTPTATGRIEILSTSTNFTYPTIAVFDGCGGSELACQAADGFPPGLRTLVDVVQNQPIRILVKNRDGAGGQPLQGTLKISSLYSGNLIVNDSCGEAAPLTAGVPFSFDSLTSTSGSAWFSYTPSQTGMTLFSACGTTNGHTMELLAYTNNCATLTQIGISGSEGTRCDGGWMVVPVTAGVPILVSATYTYAYGGPGTITATEYGSVTNDTCATAANISSGQTQYRTINASDSTDNACWIHETPDAWFRFTPAANGILNVNLLPLSAAELMDGMDYLVYSACGQQPLIGCGVYPQIGPVRVGVTAGQPVMIQIRSNYGPPTTGISGRAARGILSAVYQPLGATEWYEGNADNAGELLATAQTPTGTGALTTVMGYYNPSDRVDMYRIRITSPGSFQATSALSTTGPGAYFYLFTTAGQNLAEGYTLGSVSAAGEYYLAITPGGMGPVDDNFNVLTPGSGGVLADWLGFGNTMTKAYTVTLAGAAVVSPACPADFNGDNTRDVADLFAYINAWLAKTPNANFNGDASVDVADLFAYINAWLAGC